MRDKCNCIVDDQCSITNGKYCPCQTCLVNPICTRICYERYDYGAKNLGFKNYYMSEKDFENVADPWTLWDYTRKDAKDRKNRKYSWKRKEVNPGKK